MLAIIITFGFLAITAGLAWYLISNDHGAREPIYALWIAAGLGVLAILAAFFLEGHLVISKVVDPAMPLGIPLTFLGYLLIGAIEESCKFIPLSLFIFKRRYFNEHTDGVIYFAIAGAMFGLIENIEYTVFIGNSVGFLRIIFTPIFHAALTGIVGYYLAKGKIKNGKPWYGIAALLVAMVVHGTYDFLLNFRNYISFLGLIIVVAVSVVLFMTYRRATREDQKLGLSIADDDNFCVSCGAPNPEHHLYCTNCGAHA